MMLNRYLVKRFITVEEVADLVAFLFGPWATSITGCNWIMDGGLTSQCTLPLPGHGSATHVKRSRRTSLA
jgi:enoyl-[acyl-carrier-protein] reductase (NADH)